MLDKWLSCKCFQCIQTPSIDKYCLLLIITRTISRSLPVCLGRDDCDGVPDVFTGELRLLPLPVRTQLPELLYRMSPTILITAIFIKTIFVTTIFTTTIFIQSGSYQAFKDVRTNQYVVCEQMCEELNESGRRKLSRSITVRQDLLSETVGCVSDYSDLVSI